MSIIENYSTSITRNGLMPYEMRTTARLICDGLDADSIEMNIKNNNLFQYPTEKGISRAVHTCLRRLNNLDSDVLIEAIAGEPFSDVTPICLYALMKENAIVRDFMCSVIGEKYRTLDLSFSRKELNVFFDVLQEQYEFAASWSDSTVSKLKQVLAKTLVDAGYLDNKNSEILNSVWIMPKLEDAIRSAGETQFLKAFNCVE